MRPGSKNTPMEEAVPLSARGAARVCPAPGAACGIPAIFISNGRSGAAVQSHMPFGLGNHVRPKNGVQGGSQITATSPFVEAAILP